MEQNRAEWKKQNKIEQNGREIEKEKRCYFYFKVNAAALLKCSLKVNKLKQSF